MHLLQNHLRLTKNQKSREEHNKTYYLCVILDLYARKAVAWKTSEGTALILQNEG